MPRRSGRFVEGHAYSPATQFKPGETAHNKLPVGAVRVRREANTGLLRAWVKVAEPNVWKKRAVVVWEAIHGPLPRGHVVHHQDRDSLNDAVENLVGMTRRAHAEEHRAELNQAKAAAA